MFYVFPTYSTFKRHASSQLHGICCLLKLNDVRYRPFVLLSTLYHFYHFSSIVAMFTSIQEAIFSILKETVICIWEYI